MSECCSTDACSLQEAGAPECPSCGKKGARVDSITLSSLLTTEAQRHAVSSPRFCTTADCPVVYFDNDEAVQFDETSLTVPVFAKHAGDENVPVCYCFGHTTRSICEDRARDGVPNASKAITTEIRAGNCECELKNPSGACCLGDVVRIERAAADAGTAKA